MHTDFHLTIVTIALMCHWRVYWCFMHTALSCIDVLLLTVAARRSTQWNSLSVLRCETSEANHWHIRNRWALQRKEWVLRHVWSKADSRAFSCKRPHLHSEAHVTVENIRRLRWKQTHMTAVLSYRTCVYFYVYEVAMQKNACHDHDLTIDRRRRLFHLRQGSCMFIYTAPYLYICQHGGSGTHTLVINSVVRVYTVCHMLSCQWCVYLPPRLAVGRRSLPLSHVRWECAGVSWPAGHLPRHGPASRPLLHQLFT